MTSYGWETEQERERKREQRSDIDVRRTGYRKRTEHAVNVRSLVSSSKAKRRDSVTQLTRNEWERRCWPVRSCRWRRSWSDSLDHRRHLWREEKKWASSEMGAAMPGYKVRWPQEWASSTYKQVWPWNSFDPLTLPTKLWCCWVSIGLHSDPWWCSSSTPTGKLDGKKSC